MRKSFTRLFGIMVAFLFILTVGTSPPVNAKNAMSNKAAGIALSTNADQNAPIVLTAVNEVVEIVAVNNNNSLKVSFDEVIYVASSVSTKLTNEVMMTSGILQVVTTTSASQLSTDSMTMVATKPAKKLGCVNSSQNQFPVCKGGLVTKEEIAADVNFCIVKSNSCTLSIVNSENVTAGLKSINAMTI